MPFLPNGFQVSAVYCGLKRNPEKLDLALFVSDRPATAAGVYTKNLVFAAPVGLDRSRTPNGITRAIVVNSGNANACTGPLGDADALRMTELTAAACGLQPEEVLVMSTGVIGEFLPMQKVATGISAAAARLATDEDSITSAARGMHTTDTVPKMAFRDMELTGKRVRITGFAKGAAMIGPNMATMLSVVLTDAELDIDTARELLAEVVDDTFNCISVDGHMSTNDTVLLLANGAAKTGLLTKGNLAAFRDELHSLCAELAKSIPADGEGATHLITVEVKGCKKVGDARKIAKVISESPLVKTAIAGADPNWGRIVSAAGYAQVPFSPEGVSLEVNGFLLFNGGSPAKFDSEAVSQSIKENRDTRIILQFSEGRAEARFWTTDLTAEYVHLNADYHT